MQYYNKHIFICTNQKEGKRCCADTGGVAFFDYLKQKLKAEGLHGQGKIRITKSGCLGRCNVGPALVIYPEGVWYTYADFADLDEIITTHCLTGKIVERLQLPAV